MFFIQEGITNLRKKQNLWLGYFTKKKKKNQNRNHRRIFPKYLSFGETKNLRNNFSTTLYFYYFKHIEDDI